MKLSTALLGMAGAAVLTTPASAITTYPITLLSEDFEWVTGLNRPADDLTLAEIAPSGIAWAFLDGPAGGDGSNAAFNVRRGDNNIDFHKPKPTNWGDFFGDGSNQFLVMGDESGDLMGNPHGGRKSGQWTSMWTDIALDPLPSGFMSNSSAYFTISYRGIFASFGSGLTDVFASGFVLADSSFHIIDLLTSPGGGDFMTTVYATSLPAAPVALRFRLLEWGGDAKTSAVGLDDIQVIAVPEPETWAMLLAGLGLVGLQLRRKMNTSARISAE